MGIWAQYINMPHRIISKFPSLIPGPAEKSVLSESPRRIFPTHCIHRSLGSPFWMDTLYYLNLFRPQCDFIEVFWEGNSRS